MFALHSKRQKGFTLIELLVASTIGAMLMYAIMLVFNSASEMASIMNGDFETRQNARAIFARLEQDLTSAFIDAKGNYFIGTSTTFKCPTGVITEDEDGEHPITEVSYFVSDEKLYRTIELEGNVVSRVGQSATDEYIFADNVLMFRLRYGELGEMRPNNWPTRWDSTRGGPQEGIMPPAVEVTLQMQDSHKLMTRTFFDIIPLGQGR